MSRLKTWQESAQGAAVHSVGKNCWLIRTNNSRMNIHHPHLKMPSPKQGAKRLEASPLHMPFSFFDGINFLAAWACCLSVEFFPKSDDQTGKREGEREKWRQRRKERIVRRKMAKWPLVNYWGALLATEKEFWSLETHFSHKSLGTLSSLSTKSRKIGMYIASYTLRTT